jgi:4-amino-4-deoxy-L-arabinose transferase-like glycosyltransferase
VTGRRARRWAGPLLALLLGAFVRLPFWIEALRTPVDGDTAIVGLMARHPFTSATLWGQPYGSPLDAWLTIPFLAIVGPRAAALRLCYFALGLGLVPLAYLLGAALDRRAALPAALLVACPAPYMLLLSALPPPLYPTTLILCGLVLLMTLRLGARLAAGEVPRAGLALTGALAGLALWTHLMSASIVVACGAFLVVRARGRRGTLAFALVPLLLASAPWWVGFFTDPAWVVRVVTVSDRNQGLADHLREVLPTLARPIGGLLGARTPLIADDAEHVVATPAGAAGALILLWAAMLALAAFRSRLRGAPGLLLAAIALTIVAFPFPLRSGAHTIRYLTAAYLPLAVLAAWASLPPREEDGRRQSWIVVVLLALLSLLGSGRLFSAWRAADRSAPPLGLPDLEPVRRVLASRGLRRAYASYETAYRLTFESGERVVVTEPWNERFRHYPLPYLDEVCFAKNVAWILMSGGSGDLPTPRQFEDALNATGGRWKRAEAGTFAVYYDFAPPYGSIVEPLRDAGPAGDGDLATAVTPDPSTPLTFALSTPRSLDGVTLLAGPTGPPLPRSMDVEVSGDGSSFETVARRRRREERHDLRWVNGHPQYVLDHDVIAIPLQGRRIAAIRIAPYLSTEPWALAEVLLHPAEDPARRVPWDEWLDPGLDWKARRRALAANPRRDREDWYSRFLLAQRHR